MKKIIWVAVALAFLISGCASYNPLGIIYTNGKVGMDAKNVPATKTGKSCMTSLFGLVATGSNGLTTSQIFTLTVNQAPVFTSGPGAIFGVGQTGSFLVKTAGFPKSTITAGLGLPAVAATEPSDGGAGE